MSLLKEALGSKTLRAAHIRFSLPESESELLSCTVRTSGGVGTDYTGYRLVTLPLGHSTARLESFWAELGTQSEESPDLRSTVWFTDGGWAVWGEPYSGADYEWVLHAIPGIPQDCQP